MSRPLLLDLFCKAGGATRGYQRAGFYVVGVDIEPQPNYCGDEFVQYDALRYPLNGYDAYHASPPCQANLRGLSAVNRRLGRQYEHVDVLAETREALRATGAAYVIEQPEQGAPMVAPVRCCGTGFGLPVRRHRLFESNVPLVGMPCDHGRFTERKYWTSWVKNGERQRATVVQVYGNGGDRHEWGPALGIDWMTPDELTQAIPPAYTEHLGRQLLAHVRPVEVAA
jgi:DNA (cytosine-5)-methyltransferase 1